MTTDDRAPRRGRILPSWIGMIATCMGLIAYGCGEHGAAPRGSFKGCVPGAQVACRCDSKSGVEWCQDDGTFTACDCRPDAGRIGAGGASGSGGANTGRGGATSGTGGATSGTGGAPAGGSGGVGAGGALAGGTGGVGTGGSGGSGGIVIADSGLPDARSGDLSQGASPIVTFFVGERGIYVVLRNAVLLVDRQGAEIARVSSSRENVSAAFDGGRLVVADRGVITTIDTELRSVLSFPLVEGCLSAAIFDNDVLVCGVDRQLGFNTYDLKTGKLIENTMTFFNGAIPIVRLRGTPNLMADRFQLFTVSPKGTLSYVNGINPSTETGFSIVNAVVGDPATHVVDSLGHLLRIWGAKCDPMTNPFESGCFEKEGGLGNLLSNEAFFAMDADQNGKVYGLVRRGDIVRPCEQGCFVERIDVPSRTIEAKAQVTMETVESVRARHDRITQRLIVGYTAALPGGVLGYRLRSISYSGTN